jgi:hypothetical protein
LYRVLTPLIYLSYPIRLVRSLSPYLTTTGIRTPPLPPPMSEVPIHSRALYSPADEHSPPRRSLQQERAGSITTASSRRSRSSTKTGVAARFRRAKARIRRLQRWARKRLRSMTLGQKIVGGLALTVSATIALLTLIFHEQILHAMLPVAAQLRDWKAGWLVIFLLCFVSAFPPMVGYSTSVTAAGFVYGFPHGFATSLSLLPG